MTEYKTFDDYVKNTFNIEPRELTHISPEEQKKKTVAITVDELINIWNELTELKAGSPKWHKVADGDLPVRRCIDNDGNVVRLFHNSWDKKLTWYRYDFHECEWWQMETEPIAWCEIPEYTEE